VLAIAATCVTIAGLSACGGRTHTSNLHGAAARGEQLVADNNCLSCHSTRSNVGAAPSFRDLRNRRVKLADGTTVFADDDYLVRSILDPDAQTVALYPKGLMASVIRPGTITRAEAEDIVAYLATLSTLAPVSSSSTSAVAQP
jgi:cytochrome c oxidase subunit 2